MVRYVTERNVATHSFTNVIVKIEQIPIKNNDGDSTAKWWPRIKCYGLASYCNLAAHYPCRSSLFSSGFSVKTRPPSDVYNLVIRPITRIRIAFDTLMSCCCQYWRDSRLYAKVNNEHFESVAYWHSKYKQILTCQVSSMVTAEYSVDSYNSDCRYQEVRNSSSKISNTRKFFSFLPNKFCRRSVKQLGKKSGNTRCIAPNTKTWPIGDNGIRRMITTGINVIVSLNVRLITETTKK